MSKKTLFLLAIIFASTFKLFSQTYSITEENLKKHVYILASDSLLGRAPGTTGGKKTQQYVSNQFEEAKLQLLADSGRNCFELAPELKVKSGSFFKAKGHKWALGTDFAPFFNSYIDTVKADIVFAGYGIEIDSVQSNYSAIDAKGKWVLILRGKPSENDIPQSYYSTQAKIQTAYKHGAAGVLLVSTPFVDDADRIDMGLFRESVRNKALQADIPVIRISRKLSDSLLATCNISIIELIDSCDRSPFNFSCNLLEEASSFFDFVLEPEMACNILAFKEGSHPKLKNEIIVVGAHHDHLGGWIGRKNKSQKYSETVYHGADDNASGTAAVLELAKYFGLSDKDFKRSILFVTFDAEEKGLLGSEYMIAHLPDSINPARIKAMVNLDMVGRLAEKDTLQVLGSNSSKEGMKLVAKLAKKINLPVSMPTASWLFSASDHASFYAKGIPVFFFFTGLHPDYHKPSDTPDKIEYAGMKRITDFMELLIEDLAGRNKNLTFKRM